MNKLWRSQFSALFIKNVLYWRRKPVAFLLSVLTPAIIVLVSLVLPYADQKSSSYDPMNPVSLEIQNLPDLAVTSGAAVVVYSPRDNPYFNLVMNVFARSQVIIFIVFETNF